MVKALIGALALASLASLPSALAFRNTSPFFLFSTADLSIHGKEATLAQSTKITDEVTGALSACPSKTYFVVRQEGVSSTDYTSTDGAYRLGVHMNGQDQRVKSTMAVSEAVGIVDAESIGSYVKTQCGAELLHVDIPNWGEKKMKTLPESDQRPLVIEISIPAPPKRDRVPAMNRYDALLQVAFMHYADAGDYTVIYTTTPDDSQAELDQPPYEMEDPFGDAMQMELKRDTSSMQQRRAQTGAKKQKQGALFERYQYLSPGLFMGFIAIVPLVSIIIVAIKAITSLEVSYFAFSKEMGPAAQRKQ